MGRKKCRSAAIVRKNVLPIIDLSSENPSTILNNSTSIDTKIVEDSSTTPNNSNTRVIIERHPELLPNKDDSFPDSEDYFQNDDEYFGSEDDDSANFNGNKRKNKEIKEKDAKDAQKRTRKFDYYIYI